SWGGRLIPAQRKQAAPPSAFGADPPPHGMGRRKKGVGREADALSFVRRRTRRLPDAGALLGGDIFRLMRGDAEGGVPGVDVARRGGGARHAGRVRVGGQLLFQSLFTRLLTPHLGP